MNVAEKIELDKIKAILLDLASKIDSIHIEQPRPTLIIKREDRVNYVIDCVCDYYKIMKEDLIKRHRSPAKANRKKMAVKVLRDVADITFEEVGMALGNVSQDGVWTIYKNITEDLQENSFGNKELKKDYKALIKHIGL
jgi:chromosomal replication initiation ATPase DnaA